jgi:hypothetical protein
LQSKAVELPMRNALERMRREHMKVVTSMPAEAIQEIVILG